MRLNWKPIVEQGHRVCSVSTRSTVGGVYWRAVDASLTAKECAYIGLIHEFLTAKKIDRHRLSNWTTNGDMSPETVLRNKTMLLHLISGHTSKDMISKPLTELPPEFRNWVDEDFDVYSVEGVHLQHRHHRRRQSWSKGEWTHSHNMSKSTILLVIYPKDSNFNSILITHAARRKRMF